MNGDGRLIFGAILLIAGAGSWFLVADHPNWSNGTKSFFMIVALVFICTGLALAFAWIAKTNYKERVSYLRAKSNTEAVKVCEIISHMTPAQIDAVVQYVPLMEVISGSIDGEPNYKVGWMRTPFGLIDLAFMEEFAELCSEEYTAPIRTWAEESNRGMWARRIRDVMIYYGWIEKESYGNKSYRFLDRDRAMHFLKQKGMS